MAKDPYAKCIRKLLKIVRSADKRVARAKRRLTRVLGRDAEDPFPVTFVDCKFEVANVSFKARLSAGQGDAIKEILSKGGGAKDVVDKLHELLKTVDAAAVDAQKSLSAALLTPSPVGVPSAPPCGPELGCCTYSVGSDLVRANCISKDQCDALGGTWQLGPC